MPKRLRVRLQRLNAPIAGGRPAVAWQHWAMTVSGQPGASATSEVIIVRDYAEGDYRAGRALWAELTEYHRSIYGDPSIGGDDPGAGFDGYLATSQRAGSWVAESRGKVVGLTGLLGPGFKRGSGAGRRR